MSGSGNGERPAAPRLKVPCCDRFQEYVDDVRVAIADQPPVGPSIPRIEAESAEGWWEDPDLLPVDFCPWCGRPLRGGFRLPSSN